MLEAFCLGELFRLRSLAGAGGAQKMKDVKSNFLGMASSIQNGIIFLRTHPGSGIIMYRPEDDPQLFALMSSMDTVKSYLTVPFHIRSAGHDLTISLSNFFDNATSDFKQDFPSYTTAVQRNSSGTYDAFLIWQAGSFATWTFPNPTFNGLFPVQGVPFGAKAVPAFAIAGNHDGDPAGPVRQGLVWRNRRLHEAGRVHGALAERVPFGVRPHRQEQRGREREAPAPGEPEAAARTQLTPPCIHARLRQTAMFDPVGLWGLGYWYGVWPLHQIVFSGMLHGIARSAERSA